MHHYTPAEQLGQLLIVTDCQLDVAGHNAGLFVVAGGVAGQLQHLSCRAASGSRSTNLLSSEMSLACAGDCGTCRMLTQFRSSSSSSSSTNVPLQGNTRYSSVVLTGQVLQHSRQVDRCASTHTRCILALLEIPAIWAVMSCVDPDHTACVLYEPLYSVPS